MLLALIHVILVLASRGRFDAIAIDKVKLRKSVYVPQCSIGMDRTMWGSKISHDYIPRRIHRSPPAGQRCNRCTNTHAGTRISGKEERVEQGRGLQHTTSLRCESQKTASLISTVFATTSVMASGWACAETGSVVKSSDLNGKGRDGLMDWAINKSTPQVK